MNKYFFLCLLIMLMSVSINLCADTADTDQQVSETKQEAADAIPALVSEEINTNDPTAAAISVSAGWEFYDWYEDEIAPGQTRPTGKVGIGPALNLPADERQFGTDVWRYGFSGVFLENSFEGRLMWGFLLRQVWGKTDSNSNKTIGDKRGGTWNVYGEYRTNVV